ncbi:MAG: hypothetical protein KF777_07425 [Planctomycetaceae bacterium]|nr:hypothetical protein [Planctomycetaceae bacterium]
MFDSFKDAIRRDIEEFVATGSMQQAKALSSQTKQHFNHNQYPLYFNGALDSRIVLIHLNPRHDNTYNDTYTGELKHKTFEDYFAHHEYLGRQFYGRTSKRDHKSPFDHKQIRFLKPFGVIDFVEEKSSEDRFTNLERVLDHKLQLELIPYSSETFLTKAFTAEVVKPHLERILDVICACPRDYVLFCGSVFDDIFHDSIVGRWTFELTKKDGQSTRNKARFSTLRFSHGGDTIYAGLAHSFAQQGLPMEDYGRKCKEHYPKTSDCLH